MNNKEPNLMKILIDYYGYEYTMELLEKAKKENDEAMEATYLGCCEPCETSGNDKPCEREVKKAAKDFISKVTCNNPHGKFDILYKDTDEIHFKTESDYKEWLKHSFEIISKTAKYYEDKLTIKMYDVNRFSTSFQTEADDFTENECYLMKIIAELNREVYKLESENEELTDKVQELEDELNTQGE